MWTCIPVDMVSGAHSAGCSVVHMPRTCQSIHVGKPKEVLLYLRNQMALVKETAGL